MNTKEHIIHIAAEVAPFSKRGGLGDVVGSLPVYLQEASGIDNLIFSPFYSCMKGKFKRVYNGKVYFNGVEYDYFVYAAALHNVKCYFVGFEDVFGMDEIYVDGSKPYQTDVGLQYFIFAKSIINFLCESGIRVHSIFTHDWHAAGIYAYIRNMKAYYSGELNTIHIIHNYHHQGELFYDICDFLEVELADQLKEQYVKTGYCSMNTFALFEAKNIVTVSPSYAWELNNKIAPHPGLNLFSLLSKPVTGILNGIDENTWNPKIDKYLWQTYDYNSLEGKGSNKRELIKELNLNWDVGKPLVVYISRLTVQKGVDLFVDLKTGPAFDIFQRMRSLLEEGINFVICGSPIGGVCGSINQQLLSLQTSFSNQFHYINQYTEEIAHRLFAAGDVFLMPSRFEPCGLTQMYAMRYGTVPIVSPVGGLKDTVIDFRLNNQLGNGFYMKNYSFDSLIDAIKIAVKTFSDKNVWRKLIANGMNRDYSWRSRLGLYLDLINSKKDEPKEDLVCMNL